MLFYYINNSDRSGDVEDKTFRRNNQLQQRSDDCFFKVFSGTAPQENQDLRIYDGGIVASHSGTTIVLSESYQTDTLTFRAGQEIWLDIGSSSREQATISTYTESTRTIVLTASPSVSMSPGDQVGEIIFGGIVAIVDDKNLHSLSNIEYQITGVGYEKIFDKKIVEDSWEDVDSRYIINSFLNSVVNYNITLDTFDYDDNTAIQAAYTESGDGDNPTIDSSEYIEGNASGVLPWTNSGGTATFTGAVTSRDISFFTGAGSGTPTQGRLMLWLRTSSQSSITSITVRIGSDASNYAAFTVPFTSSTDWQYHELRFVDASVTGTPDWTGVDTPIVVVAETGSGNIQINGLRVNAEGSFTMYNVQSTPDFDDLRAPGIKPTELINLLAKNFEYLWYIDYNRDIHFVERENDPAPFSITDTSDNFDKLSVNVDTSNLGNRVIIRGGERLSSSRYAQVFEGDNAVREWILKNKFNSLEITIDDNSTTDTTEAGTNTTTINAIGHGLSVGDHIVNRTRSNAVREVLTVPTNDQFTVEAVTGQTTGDTFSLFSEARTDGIEGITDETTVDYVTNSNEKSVRATASEATLDAAEFIRFSYFERIPIRHRYTDSASANALRALGLGDGIFDLDTITDRNITDITTAVTLAQAKVREFSNPIISGSFVTDQKGLKAGQIIRITESTNRNIDDEFVIQKVLARQVSGRFKDYIIFEVVFGSTLFGWIEFMQKMLRIKDKLELNTEDVIEHYATAEEDVDVADTNQVATGGGFLTASGTEDVEAADVNNVYETTPPWHWEASTGQSVNTRWDLFEWG